MKKLLGLACLSAGFFLTVLGRPAVAGLSVEFAVGTAVTVIDDNSTGDLNPEFHIIDFDLTAPPLGGVFAAEGRVFESKEDIDKLVSLTSTPPGTYGEFLNVGAVQATFTVTVNSSPFALTGPPIGWAVYYNGKADDASVSPGDVEIPFSSVEVLTDQTEPLVTVLGPVISPPVPPSGQPVDINLSNFGSSVSQDASTIRVVFTFTAGPGDRIRLPDNNLVNAKGIQVNVFNQGAKCVDRMNNRARQIVNKAAKADYKCAKAKVLGGGDATTCVDDRGDVNTNKKETALLSGFAQVCKPLPDTPLPTWGVNGAKCCENSVADDGTPCASDGDCSVGACAAGACISYAAEIAVNDVTHDIFGSTVNVSSNFTRARCQSSVTRFAGKVLETRWKVFRTCKKDNFTSISDDATLVSTCLGPPQPDSRPINGKIHKKEAKLRDTVLKRCVQRGVTPVGLAFPGECTGAADGAFADCTLSRIKCRFCLAVNAADDIDPALDCDLFDDETANGSCS